MKILFPINIIYVATSCIKCLDNQSHVINTYMHEVIGLEMIKDKHI